MTAQLNTTAATACSSLNGLEMPTPGNTNRAEQSSKSQSSIFTPNYRIPTNRDGFLNGDLLTSRIFEERRKEQTTHCHFTTTPLLPLDNGLVFLVPAGFVVPDKIHTLVTTALIDLAPEIAPVALVQNRVALVAPDVSHQQTSLHLKNRVSNLVKWVYWIKAVSRLTGQHVSLACV
ncbi:hypothetical protein K505DRAFT_335532 [Melanomma pulvis-pyrius CBS 109.77]|uniref:Uncharacterized protein n=1 Tax=Melanomma pulvis-pyrius CBS 109.77 TaxID=1314802 RepID=A0A6A6XI22_9PLEO|nr:hypothetical protein K505DRAFT_335532 [Melanomma pulvis-pyrius CBS 109.77]